MITSDRQMMRLMDILIFQKRIEFQKDFCREIGILPQTITKIKRGQAHFTPQHIEAACRAYDANANWIFGIEGQVFRSDVLTEKSIIKVNKIVNK